MAGLKIIIPLLFKESRFFTFALFHGSIYFFEHAINKQTLIEFAIKKLGLESKFYEKIITGKEPLPLSFNSPDYRFDSSFYDKMFSRDVPFADSPSRPIRDKPL